MFDYLKYTYNYFEYLRFFTVIIFVDYSLR
jgi:hypothetical protein